MKTYFLAACLCLLPAGNVVAGNVSADAVWSGISDQAAYQKAKNNQKPWVQPAVFQLAFLNRDALEAVLRQAPSEQLQPKAAQALSVSLEIPAPDGSYAKFALVESPIMEPELAARHPDIKTYSGSLVSDPTVVARFDWTPDGFHAQVIDHGRMWYVDPYYKGESYVSYNKSDYHPQGKQFHCLTADGYHSDTKLLPRAAATALSSGDIRRTFRIAVACTGEYAQFHGGTKDKAFSAIATTINRVTGIYEYELAVRLTLVARNDNLLFTNASTDPFSNNNSYALIDESQYVINSVIGAANYDIGHTVSTGGGGLAGLGVVCDDSSKARGITGSDLPIGDAYDVDYVAHEVGHQFGADHTFNGTGGSCNGNLVAGVAYEPGSGSTIMAYAGICSSDDLQAHSDAVFHSASYDQILSYLTNGYGGICAAYSFLPNAIPNVDAGSDYTIPAKTPFVLSGTATDGNGDALTYLWEERDLGVAAALAAADDGQIPLFRVWTPTSSGRRYFPKLQTLISNTPTTAEKLPQQSRTMTFRLTARDGKGGVNSDEMQVAVDATAGPFVVTAPNAAATFTGGSTIEVTWNVANTTAAPINADTVDIYLSTDEGVTWSRTLQSSTPNDGTEMVTLPDINTSSARIIVKGSNNIFFDISDANFSIQGTQSSPSPAFLMPILKLLQI